MNCTIHNLILRAKALAGFPPWQDTPEPEGYELIRWDDFDFMTEYWSKSLPWEIQNSPFTYSPDQVTHLRATGTVCLYLSRWQPFKAGLLCTTPIFEAGDRIQIKARFDRVPGFFPALWLWSIPAGREYDIMECTGGVVWMSAHKWNGRHEVSRCNFAKTINTKEWHVYEIELLRDRVCWYVNGQMVQVHKTWPPVHPMMLIMSAGCTDWYTSTAATPCMEIDWVKIYQKV